MLRQLFSPQLMASRSIPFALTQLACLALLALQSWKASRRHQGPFCGEGLVCIWLSMSSRIMPCYSGTMLCAARCYLVLALAGTYRSLAALCSSIVAVWSLHINGTHIANFPLLHSHGLPCALLWTTPKSVLRDMYPCGSMPNLCSIRQPSPN